VARAPASSRSASLVSSGPLQIVGAQSLTTIPSSRRMPRNRWTSLGCRSCSDCNGRHSRTRLCHYSLPYPVPAQRANTISRRFLPRAASPMGSSTHRSIFLARRPLIRLHRGHGRFISLGAYTTMSSIQSSPPSTSRAPGSVRVPGLVSTMSLADGHVCRMAHRAGIAQTVSPTLPTRETQICSGSLHGRRGHGSKRARATSGSRF